MIRRDVSTNDPAAKRWILISQIEHARLAHQLAEPWGAEGFAPLAPRDELLWAIEHHDDGWREWEQTPDVDPERGQPRSFTEMELDVSLTIWRASIEIARRAGPLEAALVAGHFCALARRFAGWRQDDPHAVEAQRFVAHFESQRDLWQQAWQEQDRGLHTPAVAQRALAQLQFFDALSLWFCCAEAQESEQVETPGGPVLLLRPQDPQHIRLTAWPLVVDQLRLEIPARGIPAAPYASRAALAQAPSEPLILRWDLLPGR